MTALDLEIYPNTLLPIAARSAGLLPTVFFAIGICPLPVIVINTKPEFRFVLVFFFDPPAVAIVVANNGSRGARRTESHDTGQS